MMRTFVIGLVALGATVAQGAIPRFGTTFDKRLTTNELGTVAQTGATMLPTAAFVDDGHGGEPVWDGRETVAVAERFARRITLFRVGDGMAERLWDEELSGNPESPLFVDGRLYLPCGYQGLLMQK